MKSEKQIKWCERTAAPILQTTRHIGLAETLEQAGVAHLPVIRLHQTHSDHIVTVTDPVGPGVHFYDDADAVITRLPNLVLAIRTADCLPVIIYHPQGGIAGIHAGRRGTEQGISGKTVSEMVQAAGTNAGFRVWFGPAICVNCYQIDPVLDLHFDLIAENKAQIAPLLDSASTEWIETGLCTACRNDLFFSYRKEGTAERIFSMVYLNRV